jgi:hypothetical protein
VATFGGYGVVQHDPLASGEDNQRFAFQASPGQPRFSLPRVGRGNHDSETFPAEHDGVEPQFFRERYRAGQAEREAPLGNHLPHPLRGGLLEMQRNLGEKPAVLGKKSPKKGLGRWANVAEA